MMHDSVEHVRPLSTDKAMSTSAHEYESHAPVFSSGDRITVPPHAIELLRESIKARKEGSGAALNEKIRSAAAMICAEAHRTEAVPEKLLMSIKELCHSLPEYETISGARERDAFVSVVVTFAIEEYYRASPPRVSQARRSKTDAPAQNLAE
jgi:hypothetical protein